MPMPVHRQTGVSGFHVSYNTVSQPELFGCSHPAPGESARPPSCCLLSAHLPHLLHVNRHALDLRGDHVVGVKLIGGQFAVHHDDERHRIGVLAPTLAQPDPHANHMPFGEQFLLVRVLDFPGALEGLLPFLVLCHIVTPRASNTVWIGLNTVACEEPANSSPTARRESASTSSEPESPPCDIGVLTI